MTRGDVAAGKKWRMIEGAAIGLGRALARQSRTNEASKQAALKQRAEAYKNYAPTVARPTAHQIAVVSQAVDRVNRAPEELVKYVPAEMPAARLLDMLERAWLGYMRFDRADYAPMLASWVAHTHFVNDEGRLFLPFSPRLLVMADPQSGKTRLLEILLRLVFQGLGPFGDATGPGLRNALEKHHTVLLDELHLYVSTRGVKSYLNQYTPEGGSLNGVDGINSQSTFGPIAMAGIREKLEDARLFERVMEDTMTRCVKVYLKRKKPDKLDPMPRLDENFRKDAINAGRAISLWGAQCRPDDPDEKLWPIWDLPDELESRNWDMAVAMCAVADRAIDERPAYALSEVQALEPGQPDEVIEMTDEYAYRWPRKIRRACVNILTNAGDIEQIAGGLDSLFSIG